MPSSLLCRFHDLDAAELLDIGSSSLAGQTAEHALRASPDSRSFYSMPNTILRPGRVEGGGHPLPTTPQGGPITDPPSGTPAGGGYWRHRGGSGGTNPGVSRMEE